MKDKLKIGIDIHGVIDLYPDKFKYWAYHWTLNGHEVHIITGQEWAKAKETVERHRISYTHHFSIVDYHRKIRDVKMWQDKKKTWWMNSDAWLRSKGDYIRRKKIDIHFDDSWEYAEYIPDFCTFLLVPKKNFILPTGGW